MRKLYVFFFLFFSFLFFSFKSERLAKEEVIVLGGGNFWCVEGVFENMKGVSSVVSGYSGGEIDDPTFKEVNSGKTNHIEVVELVFNPKEVSLSEILDVFWLIHDPTTKNRQGHDVGKQYRSAIFYTSNSQKTIIEQSIAMLEAGEIFVNPVLTKVTKFSNFFKAEEFHQDYYKNYPEQSYCQFVVRPKVELFMKKYSNKIK